MAGAVDELEALRAAIADLAVLTAAPTGPPTVAASLVTRGCWRAGEENHPDHGYAEDA